MFGEYNYMFRAYNYTLKAYNLQPRFVIASRVAARQSISFFSGLLRACALARNVQYRGLPAK
jgi:hypothetical protein